MLLPLSLFLLLLFDILGFITTRASPLMVNTRELESRRASPRMIPIRIAVKKKGSGYRTLLKQGDRPPRPFQSDDDLVLVFGTLVAFQVSRDGGASGQPPKLSVKELDIPRSGPSKTIDHNYLIKLGRPDLVARFNEAPTKEDVVERFIHIDQLLLETKQAFEYLGEPWVASQLIIEDELDYFSLMMISMQLEYGKEGNPVLPGLGEKDYVQWPSIYEDMKEKRGRQPNETMLQILQGSYYHPRVPPSRRPNLQPMS
ncbi:hypothetical protein F5051DRAFT_64872 [Lentinula edodes]|nr:hypothetical protein F5051DRAFT_64872 [Lentinula edodes]